MPGVAGGGLPSLAQILNWNTEQLARASGDWAGTAERWEEAFDTIHRGTLSPGGTVWEGAAAEAAQEQTFGDLVSVRRVSSALQEAATVARRGADHLGYLKQQALFAIADAQADGFTVGPDLSVTDTADDRGARGEIARQHADTIGERAAALGRVDREVAAEIRTLSGQLGQHEFPESPSNDTHMLDVPLAPATDPPYPINDVIDEATDLDGNHVVLRRGYYDAAKDRGFGWDKMYWKHGVVNPNVFKDLITHSRPIENQGGTLVYEVPINRAHCTPGFFGTSCTDTGESVTMRIVVNTNPSDDVPDGGQKGVITMYPLPGGSGVVEVKKNWTLTPPWVNNNVPIN